MSRPAAVFHDVGLRVSRCLLSLVTVNSQHGQDDHLMVKDTIPGPGRLTHSTLGVSLPEFCFRCHHLFSTTSDTALRFGEHISVPERSFFFLLVFSRGCSLGHFMFRMHRKCLSYSFEINAIDLLNTDPEWFSEEREKWLNLMLLGGVTMATLLEDLQLTKAECPH